ncbi:MAG: hypothetical protein K2X93_12510 [Candidatus Obscuribacterales bacterium]|nr:hypothetical protein [Candidatus Obscuribacterales bacterium]
MTVEGKPCRHEYVRIYQRRLKGLDRRLVATKAYLPVGFKVGDFGHLSEGSYCFCATCRKRLFPKRSQAEKDQARLEKQQAKLAGITADFSGAGINGDEGGDTFLTGGAGDTFDFEDKAQEFEEEKADDDKIRADVQIDELEVESVDVEDIKAEGVVILVADEDESCVLDEVDES